MSEFISRNLTNQGLNLIASAINGGSIEFTKIQLGSGTYEDDTAEATSLVELRHTLQINKIERKGSNVILNASLIAKEIKDSFYWKEIGVWAKGSDGKEILYLYSYTAKASYISAEMQNEKLIQLIVMVGNVENVTVMIDNSLVYLTKADLEPILDELRDKDKELKKEIDDLALQIGNIRLDWDSIENRPDKFPPEEHPHNWNEIKEKPTSYPPSSHPHNASDIIGLPTTLPANGGNADTVDNKHASDFVNVQYDMIIEDLNNPNYPYSYRTGTALGRELGLPYQWAHIDYYRHGLSNGYGFQMSHPLDPSGGVGPILYRASLGTSWTEWHQLYDSAHKPSCADIGAATSGHGHTWSSITGRPSTFPPATHAHAWADITGKPSSFPPATHEHERVNGVKFYPGQTLATSGAQYFYAFNGGNDTNCYVMPFSTFALARHDHNWDSILNKPSVFSPSAHRHNASDINNVACTYGTNEVNIADTNIKQFYGTCVTGSSSAPNTDWWHILNIPHGDNNGYGGQIATGYHGNAGLQVRSANGTSWGPWYDVIGTIENLKRQLEGTMKPEKHLKGITLESGQTHRVDGSGYIYFSSYGSSGHKITDVNGNEIPYGNYICGQGYSESSSDPRSYRVPYRDGCILHATNGYRCSYTVSTVV